MSSKCVCVYLVLFRFLKLIENLDVQYYFVMQFHERNLYHAKALKITLSLPPSLDGSICIERISYDESAVCS
jgi:hypothetical protein